MAMSENDVVNRMCTSKRTYDTLKDARTMRNHMERYNHKKGELRVYECPICSKYHLTHAPLTEQPSETV